MGRLLDIAAALICIGAGVYLLQYNGDARGCVYTLRCVT
jgi:hypothetical protein